MLNHLTNQSLLTELKNISIREKKLNLEFLDYLREVDQRAAYVELGFSSLYAYVTDGLGYPNDQAYLRINAIRIIHKNPEVKKELENNQFTFSTLAMASQITNITKGSDKEVKLTEALALMKGQTKTEAKEIVNSIKDQENAKDKPKVKSKLESRRITLTLSEEEYSLIQEVLKLKNKDAKDLLIIKCREEKRKLETEKIKEVKTTSRHIPAQVKREVLTRAGFKCERTGCQCDKNLEFAHIEAYSKGGSHEAKNIKLLCRAHHKYETFLEFGKQITTHNR